MKKVLNVVLLGLVIALVYANFNSVNAPLDFDKKRLERDLVVIDRLVDIRTAQVEYRAQNGRYAATFDELIAFLDDSMKVVNKTYILNDKQLALVRDYMVEDSTGAKTYYTDEKGKKRSKVYTKEDAENLSFSEDKADQIVLNILNDDNKKNAQKNAKRIEKLDALYRRDTTWIVKSEVLEDGSIVDIADEIVSKVIALGAYEICPKGGDITAERVAEWKRLGLGVRAWGISNTDIMKAVYDAGVDGMTVNFPDKLVEYINEKSN